ncbi:MAG: single-stranded-DNA-specific exonuclease RecJ [Patescibacteria group bacterium]
MKKWQIIEKLKVKSEKLKVEDIVSLLLKNRGFKTKSETEEFLNPPNPYTLGPQEVEINKGDLRKAISRLKQAIKAKESIVVYADYDADGISAGAIMWETLHELGANVMPYVPHRVEEGYGLSVKGIDAVREQYDPSLIITVDHGITAKEKVAYAQKLGIEVIVTDHHVRPKILPDCITLHTTKLSGAGVAWFLAKEILKTCHVSRVTYHDELLALAAIGTIADMVPLKGPNRSITKYGLLVLNKTKRVGLVALIADAGLFKGDLGTYDVSHILAPRLNAMGRIEHALDALRLLCTRQAEKAALLARRLGLTNRQRQQLTEETTVHALEGLSLRTQGETLKKKLIFISHESYNQGVIGLVAGKLVEEFYRPSIVVSRGEIYSKASARSINGFNIVEAIRSCSDILVDVGGHPMAAGFTVETKNLAVLQERLEALAEQELNEEKLARVLKIDVEIPLAAATEELWRRLREFEPFGFGNPEPVFATRGVMVQEARLVGAEGKHLKLRVKCHVSRVTVDTIAFNMGNLYGKLKPDISVDLAYTIDMDTWNGNRRLQLKVKDIKFS